MQSGEALRKNLCVCGYGARSHGENHDNIAHTTPKLGESARDVMRMCALGTDSLLAGGCERNGLGVLHVGLARHTHDILARHRVATAP